MNCFAHLVKATFAKDHVFEVDIAEAHERLLELYAMAESQSELSTAPAYWDAIAKWVESETGKAISYSQAMAFERHVFAEMEEFKKKLPELPKSPTSLSSTPANSTPPHSAGLPPTSPESTPSTKGSEETQTAR